MKTDDEIEAIENELVACEALIRELVAALKEARENIEHWGEYAGDYFREKHDLAGDLAGVDAVLAKAKAEGFEA